ncbi:hypothetical protein Purlil1_13041 [Purpureocillium lilacinum]|uniref:Uncharacterized protein n=1 Tax=Purpureocillium lilacinum TaxID=33203 RepID=A0ABR0BF81_PURLI|nr:hypothetical protein Purlil1_13041 [Purpureocillium lilacinum]
MVVRHPGPERPGAAVIDNGSLFRLPGKRQQQWRPSASAHYERGSRRPSPSSPDQDWSTVRVESTRLPPNKEEVGRASARMGPGNTSEGLVLDCAPVGDKATAEPRICSPHVFSAASRALVCQRVLSRCQFDHGWPACGRAHMQSWPHLSTLVTGQGLPEERPRSFPGRPPSPTIASGA